MRNGATILILVLSAATAAAAEPVPNFLERQSAGTTELSGSLTWLVQKLCVGNRLRCILVETKESPVENELPPKKDMSDLLRDESIKTILNRTVRTWPAYKWRAINGWIVISPANANASNPLSTKVSSVSLQGVTAGLAVGIVFDAARKTEKPAPPKRNVAFSTGGMGGSPTYRVSMKLGEQTVLSALQRILDKCQAVFLPIHPTRDGLWNWDVYCPEYAKPTIEPVDERQNTEIKGR